MLHVGCPLLASSSLSLGALWRYYLRQEPDAVTPHVRTRGGGYGNHDPYSNIAQLQVQKIGWRSRKRLLLRAAEIFKAAKKAVRLKHGCGSG